MSRFSIIFIWSCSRYLIRHNFALHSLLFFFIKLVTVGVEPIHYWAWADRVSHTSPSQPWFQQIKMTFRTNDQIKSWLKCRNHSLKSEMGNLMFTFCKVIKSDSLLNCAQITLKTKPKSKDTFGCLDGSHFSPSGERKNGEKVNMVADQWSLSLSLLPSQKIPIRATIEKPRLRLGWRLKAQSWIESRCQRRMERPLALVRARVGIKRWNLMKISALNKTQQVSHFNCSME